MGEPSQPVVTHSCAPAVASPTGQAPVHIAVRLRSVKVLRSMLLMAFASVSATYKVLSSALIAIPRGLGRFETVVTTVPSRSVTITSSIGLPVDMKRWPRWLSTAMVTLPPVTGFGTVEVVSGGSLSSGNGFDVGAAAVRGAALRGAALRGAALRGPALRGAAAAGRGAPIEHTAVANSAIASTSPARDRRRGPPRGW